MKVPANAPMPEHVLEIMYHRELGYSLHDGDDVSWSFASAFVALNYNPTPIILQQYRDLFIERGYGKFDGASDPSFRIGAHGESEARKSIARRLPIYHPRHLETFNWNLWGGIAAILAAIFSFIALIGAK